MRLVLPTRPRLVWLGEVSCDSWQVEGTVSLVKTLIESLDSEGALEINLEVHTILPPPLDRRMTISHGHGIIMHSFHHREIGV